MEDNQKKKPQLGQGCRWFQKGYVIYCCLPDCYCWYIWRTKGSGFEDRPERMAANPFLIL